MNKLEQHKQHRLCCYLLLATLVFCVETHAECSLQILKPQGSVIHADTLTISLGEADDIAHPAAWQGPLVAGSCKFELSIIEQPLALGAGRYLYVPTYSGSIRNLTLFDLNDCSIRWKSAAFSGSLKINQQGLNLGGKRFKLNGDCLPIADN